MQEEMQFFYIFLLRQNKKFKKPLTLTLRHGLQYILREGYE